MITTDIERVAKLIFDRHRKRFPADEHLCIMVDIDDHQDVYRIHVSRMKGYGLDCKYRHAVAFFDCVDLQRDGKERIVNRMAEAIEDAVRLLLRSPAPEFRIRRDARRLTHRPDRGASVVRQRPALRFAFPRQ